MIYNRYITCVLVLSSDLSIRDSTKGVHKLILYLTLVNKMKNNTSVSLLVGTKVVQFNCITPLYLLQELF